MPNAEQNVEKQVSHSFLVRMQNASAFLADSLAIIYCRGFKGFVTAQRKRCGPEKE